MDKLYKKENLANVSNTVDASYESIEKSRTKDHLDYNLFQDATFNDMIYFENDTNTKNVYDIQSRSEEHTSELQSH